jgi:hypothetical protein
MADNGQNSNNSQPAPAQQGTPSADQNGVNNSTAAINAGWITVNTSDSFEAQRMNIMKGNNDNLFTKSER